MHHSLSIPKEASSQENTEATASDAVCPTNEPAVSQTAAAAATTTTALARLCHAITDWGSVSLHRAYRRRSRPAAATPTTSAVHAICSRASGLHEFWTAISDAYTSWISAQRLAYHPNSRTVLFSHGILQLAVHRGNCALDGGGADQQHQEAAGRHCSTALRQPASGLMLM